MNRIALSWLTILLALSSACVDDAIEMDLAYIDSLTPVGRQSTRFSSAEKAFGRELFAHIIESYGIYGEDMVGNSPHLSRIRVVKHSGLQGYVNSVLQSLNGTGGIRVVVLDISDAVHFGVPGIIAVSTGALMRTRNKHEIAGLLAHELAAFKRRSLARSVYPNGIPQAASVPAAAKKILVEGFNRADEKAFDTDAMTILKNSGFQSMEYIQMLLRWSSESNTLNFNVLSRTHPALSARIGLMNAFYVRQGFPASRDIPESPQLLKYWQEIVR